MYPFQHLIFGLIFSLVLFLIFPQIGIISFSILFLSTILIDVDHYLYYVFRKKDLNPFKAYKWFLENESRYLKLSRTERNRFYSGFFVLHGLETLALLFLLSFFYSFFFLIFLGFTFHLTLDHIVQPKYFDRIDRISIIYDYMKFKNLKLFNG